MNNKQIDIKEILFALTQIQHTLDVITRTPQPSDHFHSGCSESAYPWQEQLHATRDYHRSN